MKFKTFITNKWVKLFGVLLIFCIYCILATLFLGTACIFNVITGLPCPACGMTRANLLALTFQFGAAWNMHPLFFFSAIVLALTIVATALPNFAKSRAMTILCAVLITALLITYLVRMILLFPNMRPMTYNWNSLLGKLIGLFRHMG